MATKGAILNLQNVCRLCGNKMDLMCIFDTKLNFPQPMNIIVLAVTTIQIDKDDFISQKICSRCVTNAIKMYQFRSECIMHDQELWKQFEDILKVDETLRNSVALSKVSKLTKKDDEKTDPQETVKPAATPQTSVKPSGKTYTLHSSVKNLFKAYPQLRMPAITLKCDINPSVVMELDAVENYFKVRKLNMGIHVQRALKGTKAVAVKSTSAPAKCLSINPFSKENTKSTIRRKKDAPDPEPPKLPEQPASELRQKRKRSFSPTSKLSVKKLLVEDTVSLSSSLSPVPSNFSEDFSDICDISKKSHELHVCNICNSVHYYARNLKKHLIKHLYCQFCKRKFKTIEIKEEHIESSCSIRKAMKGMINLPDVRLIRVELDEEIRRKYAAAFTGYLNDIIRNAVIEIAPDEDNTCRKDKDAPNKFARPIIEITDNKIALDHRHSNEVKLLKALLTSYNKNLKTMNAFNKMICSETQTVLPTNELIKTNLEDVSIEMQTIIQQMYYYKIPIEIKYGATMNASYAYDCRNNDGKEIEHWDDLIPIDLRNDSHQISILEDYIKTEELLIEDIHSQSLVKEDEEIDESENEVDIEGIELVDMEVDQKVNEDNFTQINNDETDEDIDMEIDESVNKDNCLIDPAQTNPEQNDALKERGVPNGDTENSSSQDDCFDEIMDGKENGCDEKLLDRNLLITEDEDVSVNSKFTNNRTGDNRPTDEANPFCDPLFITDFPKKSEMNLDDDDPNFPVNVEATASDSNDSSNSFHGVRAKTVFEFY